MISDNPKISIIIPVHNEGENIIKVLESVKNVSYYNKELIIVDDSDDIITSKLVEEWIEKKAHNEHHVKYLKYEKRLGVSRARNIGIEHANGEFIFLLDADVILKEEAFLEALKTLKSDPEIGAVSILYLHENPSILEKIYASRYIGRIKKGSLATGAVIIPKGVIEKVGYFNECLGYPHQVYEDWEYGVRINRMGFKTYIDGRVVLTHLPKSTSIIVTSDKTLCFSFLRLREYISSKRAEALFRVLISGNLKLKLEYLLYAISSWIILLLPFMLVVFNASLLYKAVPLIIAYLIMWLIYYLFDFGFSRFKEALLFTYFSLISRHARALALTLWFPVTVIKLRRKC
jgi:glycosyltransferase involved in cell wall biosynthesis